MRAPKASVVVLTLNAGAGFGALLDRLLARDGAFDREVLVVDSGSTDGTVELARQRGATVHRLSPDEFEHGATRNLAVSLTVGEYVAFIVQDALPLDEVWLPAMVEILDRDERVAGVYGRQLPRPGSGPLTRVLVKDWPTAATDRREQFVENPSRYAAMSPAGRRSLALFDNVSSCVRRSVWEEFSFDKTPFGEDVRWGKRVVEAGYKLVYEPRSAVYHSHERGALYDVRRHYAEGLVLLDLFGFAPTPNLPRLLLNSLRSWAYLFLRLRRDERASGGVPRHALLAAGYAAPSQLGAYLAAKNRRLAGSSPRLSAALDRLVGGGV